MLSKTRKKQMTESETVLWACTALLAGASVYISAMMYAAELGGVMHDIHCPDHRSTL